MANLAAHAINKLYKSYHSKDIAFNASVIRFSGLEPKKVFLKVKGEQWSCVLYSCSLKSAKVVVNIDQQGFEIIKRAKNFVNLRLSFLPSDLKSSIVFFIPTHIEGYKNFNSNHKNVYLMNLKFTQKPPDDLIEIIGTIIQEKEEFDSRKDVRINLEGKIIWDIGLTSNRAAIDIDGEKKTCILRNLSAGGTFILLSHSTDQIIDKEIKLFLSLSKNKTFLQLNGIIKHSEKVQGRDEIYALGIEFIKEQIPIDYKQMINRYLNKLEDIVKDSKKTTAE